MSSDPRVLDAYEALMTTRRIVFRACETQQQHVETPLKYCRMAYGPNCLVVVLRHSRNEAHTYVYLYGSSRIYAIKNGEYDSLRPVPKSLL